MTTWVALLRGINVGGHKKVRMADLRKVVDGIGYSGVETYVQSGNVVLDARDGEQEGDVVAALGTAIESEFGFEVPVVVRAGSDMARIARQHPFDDGDVDPKLLLVGFFDMEPVAEIDDVLDPADFVPDRWVLKGRELYLAYPAGAGRSKLTNTLIERRLGVSSTTRNWRTVTKLAGMTGD